MIWWLYNLALVTLSPAIATWLLYRLVVKGKSRDGLSQRLGSVPPSEGGAQPIWVHAVSAGEMVAAAAVVRALQQRAPEAEIVVSTTTPAGLGQARRLIADAQAIFYFPFDYLPCVRRALSRVRPALFVAVETEIWPNFYREASRVRVCGNTKFDQAVPSLTPGEAARLRRAFGLLADQPIWIAGSTHPGEEEQVLEAWDAIRETAPDLALIIAPRHVERADGVEALCLKRYAAASLAHHPVLRRSRLTPLKNSEEPGPGRLPPVILLDTVGELAAFYGLASVVFVGGSLVPIGGHDVLQPLFHARPTFFGPHMHNQRDMAALATASGAAEQVSDAEALGSAVRAVLTDPARARAMAGAAASLLAANRGAADRCADLILELLGPQQHREHDGSSRRPEGVPG